MRPDAILDALSKVPTCSHEQFVESARLTVQYTPAQMPFGWQDAMLPAFMVGGTRGYLRRGDQLKVLVSATRGAHPDDGDQRVWLHVSLSRRHRLPSYEDIVDVKRIFIGPDRQAIQFFTKESKHVNIDPYVLHLWCCVEGDDGLPDFGKFGVI